MLRTLHAVAVAHVQVSGMDGEREIWLNINAQVEFITAFLRLQRTIFQICVCGLVVLCVLHRRGRRHFSITRSLSLLW